LVYNKTPIFDQKAKLTENSAHRIDPRSRLKWIFFSRKFIASEHDGFSAIPKQDLIVTDPDSLFGFSN
jgi:hypothetical protein